MSQRTKQIEEGPTTSDTGLEARQSTGKFREPVEALDGHEDTKHFALLYEDRAEQFATVVSYIRQGLERDERCLYIVDEDSREDVVAALADGGIDVEGALQTGQLSILSVEETYLEGGQFDVEHGRALLQNAIAEGLEEYAGFRVTADETWLLEEERAQTAFMTFEAHVNALLEGTPGMALCQYDRTELSPKVIEDVINTHPYLIHDGTACPNDYYTPPEEYFAPKDRARENERKLETLVDRTNARTSLRTREEYQRRFYEITADVDRSFDEKLDALFDLGCRRFDLDLGGLAKVEPDADHFEVEKVSGDHEHLVPGAQTDLSKTYCRVATEHCSTGAEPDPVAVTDPVGDGFEGTDAYEEFGVRAYLGTHLEFENAPARTFWFVSETPREGAFSEAERTFLRQMGQWVQYELERRDRERELRERTEYLSALVETTPECIKTVDDDGTLLHMNPAGLEMVEADSAAAVVGESVYDLVAPEHRERFREFNERICRGERGMLEYDAIGLNGTRRHMQTHAAPLRRPDGTVSQVALTRDVTERVERERQLEESNERLEQFAYAASHDLQEPLRMVSSYLQLIENRYGDELDADGEEFLEFAVDGAERMKAMIEGLLAYSQVEDQGDPFEPVDLDTVFEDVRQDLQVKIDEHDAEITTEPLPRVSGDGGQLNQVFQNLLSNAIEYSGDEPPRIHVDAERDGDEWVVSVSDDGIGIDPADADRIFDVFQSLHAPAEHSGTGIGLALCKRIVERHDGDIWVDSQPSDGATFSLTLPAASEH